MKEVNEYEKQATDFLKNVNGKIKIEYVEHDYFFTDDKEPRDVYKFTISRNRKSYTSKFGQSTANTGKQPRAYDILASLTQYDPETFENFCREFGYDTDSRKAEKIYKAVVKEFAGVQRVFGDVLEQLQEIR